VRDFFFHLIIAPHDSACDPGFFCNAIISCRCGVMDTLLTPRYAPTSQPDLMKSDNLTVALTNLRKSFDQPLSALSSIALAFRD
jgi:hypothetical protein